MDERLGIGGMFLSQEAAMKIHCAKCKALVAVVEKPSKIQSGASIYGACYECKNRALHDGAKVDGMGGFMAEFEKIFGKVK